MWRLSAKETCVGQIALLQSVRCIGCRDRWSEWFFVGQLSFLLINELHKTDLKYSVSMPSNGQPSFLPRFGTHQSYGQTRCQCPLTGNHHFYPPPQNILILCGFPASISEVFFWIFRYQRINLRFPGCLQFVHICVPILKNGQTYRGTLSIQNLYSQRSKCCFLLLNAPRFSLWTQALIQLSGQTLPRKTRYSDLALRVRPTTSSFWQARCKCSLLFSKYNYIIA